MLLPQHSLTFPAVPCLVILTAPRCSLLALQGEMCSQTPAVWMRAAERSCLFQMAFAGGDRPCCKISVDGPSMGCLGTQLHLNLTNFLCVNKISSMLARFWRKLSEVSRGLSFFLPGNRSRIQFQLENLCWKKIPSCFGSISMRGGQDSWERSLAGRCPCNEFTCKKRSVSVKLFWGLSVTCLLLSSSSTPFAGKILSLLLLTVIQMPGHVLCVVVLQDTMSLGTAGMLSDAGKGISLSKG